MNRPASIRLPGKLRISVFALVLALLTGCATGELTGEPLAEVTKYATPRSNPDSMLRVATINMWGIAIPFLDIALADDLEDRFSALTDRLTKNEPDLDVVLLQEMWQESAREKLLADEGVARTFPYRFDAVGEKKLRGNGLVILSRLPIVGNRVWFHRFQRRGYWWKIFQGDHLGGKGILAFQIDMPGGRAWIMNTHLIACYRERELECDDFDVNGRFRWDQIHASGDFVKNLAGSEPALIGGDFNFTRTSRYFRSLQNPALRNRLHRADDFTDSLEIYDHDRRWEVTPEPGIPAERLDFLWMRHGDRRKWIVVEPMKEIFKQPVRLTTDSCTTLSDHPALMGVYCLSEKNSGSDCETD